MKEKGNVGFVGKHEARPWENPKSKSFIDHASDNNAYNEKNFGE